jgi:hypothetical protein
MKKTPYTNSSKFSSLEFIFKIKNIMLKDPTNHGQGFFCGELLPPGSIKKNLVNPTKWF